MILSCATPCRIRRPPPPGSGSRSWSTTRRSSSQRIGHWRLGCLLSVSLRHPVVQPLRLADEVLQRIVPLVRIAPVDVQGGLDARRLQELQVGLLHHGRDIDPRCLGHGAHDLRHRSTNQVPGVFDTPSAFERRGVEGDAQLAPVELLGVFREFDRPVDELLVQVVLDCAGAEANEAALAERRSLPAERPQHEAPPLIVLGLVDRRRVAHPGVTLQQIDHREHCWRTGVLPAGVVRCDELVLKRAAEELLSDAPQEQVELARPSQPLSDGLLSTARRGLPAHLAGRSSRLRRVDRFR